MESKDFIYGWIPKYKLQAEEDVLHDISGQRKIHRGIYMSGESLDQFILIAAISKARLKPLEFMTRVHLGNRLGNSCPMMNAMGSNLPSMHRDILEVTHHQITPCIQSPGGIVRRQL